MPAPYITQEEQRATPRVERPPELTPGLRDLWVFLALVMIIGFGVLLVLILSGFFA